MTKRVCKVLVVEDNQDIRELLEMVLVGDGYRFNAVATGGEMRAALESADVFDIAVIDYHLPGGDNGVTLAKIAAGYGLGVILVSGTGDESVVDAMRDSGHAYLHKPFRLKPLFAAMEAALLLAQRDCERDPTSDCREPALAS